MAEFLIFFKKKISWCIHFNKWFINYKNMQYWWPFSIFKTQSVKGYFHWSNIWAFFLFGIKKYLNLYNMIFALFTTTSLISSSIIQSNQYLIVNSCFGIKNNFSTNTCGEMSSLIRDLGFKSCCVRNCVCSKCVGGVAYVPSVLLKSEFEHQNCKWWIHRWPLKN